MSEAGQGGALLTIFLKYRQSMNLAEINEKLDQTGVWRDFPPEGVGVVSWYVMMGTGRVVTDKLREVNLAIERCAWGAFETRFHPTYDFRPVRQSMRKSRRSGSLALSRGREPARRSPPCLKVP